MIVVAAIGLAINLGSAWHLSRANGGLNLRGALIHMLADAVGSAGAIVAGGMVLAGFPAADAAVSLGISVLILWGTVGLLRDSGRVLLEVAPRGLSVDEVHRALAELPGVADVHDLHVWTLTGEEPLLTAHLAARSDDPSLAARARAVLAERFAIRHATLQIETGGDCPGSCSPDHSHGGNP
jgi:cobalt-zinc-cadmium efflux system protein